MKGVITKAETTRVSEVGVSPLPEATPTSATVVMEFTKVKHLLSGKPLRGVARQPLEDMYDLEAIEQSKKEGKRLPYGSLRRELKLKG